MLWLEGRGLLPLSLLEECIEKPWQTYPIKVDVHLLSLELCLLLYVIKNDPGSPTLELSPIILLATVERSELFVFNKVMVLSLLCMP